MQFRRLFISHEKSCCQNLGLKKHTFTSCQALTWWHSGQKNAGSRFCACLLRHKKVLCVFPETECSRVARVKNKKQELIQKKQKNAKKFPDDWRSEEKLRPVKKKT
jgi:hypothetical protein